MVYPAMTHQVCQNKILTQEKGPRMRGAWSRLCIGFSLIHQIVEHINNNPGHMVTETQIIVMTKSYTFMVALV